MLRTVLTPNDIKHRVYRLDPDFQEMVELSRGFWPDTAAFGDMLWNTASLLLRADAIVGRQAAAVLPVLRDLGFVPVVARQVAPELAQTSRLWRYQLNVSTPERQRLLQRLMSAGPSIYLLFRDLSVRTSAPATVHMTYLKGTAILANRRRWHLRTLAGPRVANLLSYVHVSDDPADLLREMRVLFDAQRCRSILSELQAGQDRTSAALRLLADLEAATPRDLLEGQAPPRPGEAPAVAEWREIIRLAKDCPMFVGGDSYRGRDAIVPDDKELSLPLDGHLIFRELGPR